MSQVETLFMTYSSWKRLHMKAIRHDGIEQIPHDRRCNESADDGSTTEEVEAASW